MTRCFTCPAATTTGAWRSAPPAHLGRAGVALLVAGAAVAIALSALSLADERRGRGVLLFALRVAGVLACLMTALEPTIELRQVTRVPNRVAVLVDASRSMEVRPPDGGPSRAERAAALIDAAAPELTALAAGRTRRRLCTLRRTR